MVSGRFAGMNQAGTLLVLRNISPAACSVAAFSQIAFRDKQNHATRVLVDSTDAAFRGPIVNGKRLPMGHGPVVLPIAIPAGAEATATLHWVSGDVFDRGVCTDVASIVARIGDASMQTPTAARICARTRATSR